MVLPQGCCSMVNEISQPNVEERKLDIERQKLDVEREKLKLERTKARATGWSIAVSVLAAAGTIGFGLWSSYKQAESQFQLEVAKSVMQGTTSADIVGKLEFFRRIFPERLTAFGKSPTEVNSDFAFSIEAKKEFFRTAVSRDMSATQALELWIALFPGDNWPKSDEVATAIRRADPKLAR
jgi:hypothetical protein